MGSSGSFGGGAGKGGLIKQEWETVDQVDGIKIIKSNRGSASLPPYSKAPNAEYAIHRADGVLKSYAVYGQDRAKQVEIDFDHDRGHGTPHVHEYVGGARNKTPRAPSVREQERTKVLKRKR